MHKYWIPMFSHSGQEVAELIHYHKNPYMILTNRKNTDGMDPSLIRKIKVMNLRNYSYLGSHYELMEILYDEARLLTQRNFLVTLHGYMGIIPKEIIDLPNVKIYNVHPGNIVRYPELRGKDPQKRAIEGGYPTAGVVIHEVDEGIDTGKIIDSREIAIHPEWTTVDLVNKLRGLSVEMWKDIIQ